MVTKPSLPSHYQGPTVGGSGVSVVVKEPCGGRGNGWEPVGFELSGCRDDLLHSPVSFQATNRNLGIDLINLTPYS